jgi:acyl-CoA reductase-like NAD-dependent aldehyde dehydrogenase
MHVTISDNQLRAIVEKVVDSMQKSGPVFGRKTGQAGSSSVAPLAGDYGVFTDMNDAVEAAHRAFLSFGAFGPQKRTVLINAIRKVVLENKEKLSRMVLEETKMGRYEDKILKHIFAATNTPGVEEIEPRSWSGSNGLAIEEFAPYGVIGAVTPSTHPSETLVNNSIMMLAVGNTVVFNAHPGAKNVSSFTVRLLNETIVKAGGPQNLITCVGNPTIESAAVMFHHPKTKLLSITGGPVVVKAAMKSEKKVIAAGPGNPPVVIDETADCARAAERITVSGGFDNNVLCTAEKEIFVVESVFDKFMMEMEKRGNRKLFASQIEQLAAKAFPTKKGNQSVVNRDLVGRDAGVLARELGLTIPDSTRLLFGETNRSHVFVVEEQLMPFIPVVRVKDFNEGVECALVAEHGYGHTASVFTKDMERATYFARRANCSIFVINGGTYQGNGGADGEGSLSFTIATPTGEAITRPHSFARMRRIVTINAMRFV